MGNKRGNKIKDRRESLGIKQSGLAVKLGISQATLSDYERGVYLPRVDVALDIAEALECPVGSLFPKENGED